MKDTLITAAVKRRELRILLACFIAANILNLWTIVKYDTRWVEILTQIGYVVCVTVALYITVFILRRLFSALFCRKSRK